MLLLALSLLIVPLVVLKIYSILVNSKCQSNVCLIGKTALVTGGNAGIGYQIVLALAARGCRVIIADKQQDPNLKENILKETNSTNIVYQFVDLASFKSVREFANNIVKSEEKLDILVHNAGVGRTDTFITEDGLELVMQVNYFSPFLLTHLLVELLKRSSGRIIFTSSALAYVLNNLSSENLKPSNKGQMPMYSHSKLGLILISEIFSQKLKQYKITSNSYHPGIVNTGIFQETIRQSGKVNIKQSAIVLLTHAIGLLAMLVGKTPQEGAQTAIYLACANEVKDVSGMFFYEMKPTFKPNKIYDKKYCNSIWNATEEIVKLQSHEVL